jgi:hypothetical protein
VDFDPAEELTALREAVAGPVKDEAPPRAREIDEAASQPHGTSSRGGVLDRDLWRD